jgi:Holliday junction DNA helicase RuvA
MYEYFEGPLQAVFTDSVIIDVGGIGYHIHVSKTCPSRCTPLGQKLKLYVDLIVREDSLSLFGFATPGDRDFFRLLQQVNGIGPKVALNILSHAPAPELAAILFRKDTKSLSAIPGIGKKLAERLVVELYERIGDFVTSSSTMSITQDAIRALQTLGFTSTEARSAISTVQKEHPTLSSIEQLVQHALSMKR